MLGQQVGRQSQEGKSGISQKKHKQGLGLAVMN
jgi:hypothetical protein